MNAITRHPIRSLVVALAATIMGFVLLAVVAAWLWPADELRERITQLASDRLALPVHVDGDVALRFWPSPTIQATEVRIGPASGDDPISEVAAIRLSMRWWPLVSGHLVPETLQLDAPVARLTPGIFEALAARGPPTGTGRGDQIEPLDLQIRDGEVHWRTPAGDREVSIEGLDLDLNNLKWQPVAGGEHPLAGVSLDLTASAEAVRIDALALSDMTLSGSGEDGMFATDDWQLTFLDSRGNGNATLDFRTAPAETTLDLAFDSLQLAKLPAQWAPAGSVSGRVDLSASLKSNGGLGSLLRHLQGEVKLSGRDLRLRGVDLDAELADYRRTQRFSLVDAGAVIFLGPAGLLATKGSDFVRLLDGAQDKQTRVVHLVSDWTIQEGTARTRDVALSTPHNRVAARASLDLPSRRINQATVAVVDQQGCPVVTQAVHGSFDAPQVEEPNLVKALFGAPIGLLKRGLAAISRGDESCEVFYAGSVAAPSN
ncbi:AsmA family protein [Guyparkeria halophila]|uniref:AsmA family protein n=1 Tax=Guyparkeria halophila TaxID=47960 RepID=A0ABZ0Z1L6_9GAMM|nr:AsmA family protein [Guyparkeria halophila]WQH17255.1 AsmA family protein [Guyparkeria halophila]